MLLLPLLLKNEFTLILTWEYKWEFQTIENNKKKQP